MELSLCVSDEREHDDERVWQNLLCIVLVEALKLSRYRVVGTKIKMIVD